MRKTRLAMIKTKSFKVYNSTLALLEEELNLGKQTSFCSSLGCHLGGRAAQNERMADNFLCTAEIVVHSSSQILQWLSKSTLVVVGGEQFSLCSASHHHRSLLLRVGEGAKLIRLVHACKITKLCTFSNFSSLLWSWHRRPISIEKRATRSLQD